MNTPVARQYTRNILVRLLVFALIAIALMVWQREFLYDVYVRNQITHAGWFINGGILLLFLVGLVRLVNLFFRYADEESDVTRFMVNLQRSFDPMEGIDAASIIAVRYRMLRELYARRAPINQSALAASLVAAESSYLSFPKFVNNVLILTGVFGTIVSLSIALLGASDMLRSTAELGGLSTVIHGMSTALSTTMTAILCYLFFGYFYLKLTDTQTYLISRVEQITTTTLMPRFHVQPETALQEFAEMIRATGALVHRLEENHQRFAETALMLQGLVTDAQTRVADIDRRFEQIGALLREGFRLPEDES